MLFETKNKTHQNFIPFLVITSLVLLAIGCTENPSASDEEITEEMLAGESATLGTGETDVWAVMFTGRDSLAFNIGLNIPMDVINNPPQNHPDTVSLDFPDEVQVNTAVQFVTATWPVETGDGDTVILAQFYLEPKSESGDFDYTIPASAQDAIHLGIDGDNLVYYELVLSQNTLKKEEDKPLMIPTPASAQVPDVVPTTFLADFQEDNNRYAMTWTGLDAGE